MDSHTKEKKPTKKAKTPKGLVMCSLCETCEHICKVYSLEKSDMIYCPDYKANKKKIKEDKAE